MTLYRRAGIFHYDFTVDGKRFRGSTKQTSEYKAGLVLNSIMSAKRKDGSEAITGKPPLLKDFASDFLEWVETAHSIERKTRLYYKNGWRLLKDTKLVEYRMDRITNHDCEIIDFPGSNSNANSALRTLRRMFSKAKELKRIQNEPEIELRKEWGRSIVMTQDNAALIAAKMKEGDARDAFLVIRHSGPVRPSEVFEMRWEYLSIGAGLYHNPKGKTKRSRRTMPVFGEALSVLSRRWQMAGLPAEGWVFPSDSKSGHLTTIKAAFNEARDAAGLPKGMVLYTARHGQATDMGNKVSLKELMDSGGWSDTATALRYQHPDVSAMRARLEGSKFRELYS